MGCRGSRGSRALGRALDIASPTSAMLHGMRDRWRPSRKLPRLLTTALGPSPGGTGTSHISSGRRNAIARDSIKGISRSKGGGIARAPDADVHVPGTPRPTRTLGDTAATDGRARAGLRALGDVKQNETLVEQLVTVTSQVTSR